MDLKAGFPYSLIKNGLPFDYPKLQEDLKTDVLILGGGISGALTAFYLVKAGISCALVDGRSIGLGSTCASTSLLQYEIDTPLHLLSGKIGSSFATRAYRQCEEAIHILGDISSEISFPYFSWKQSLLYASRKTHTPGLVREFQARKEAGFKVDLLSPQEIATDFGIESSKAILSECGAIADAYMLTHYLLQFCIQRGLKVYDRTRVTAIKHEPQKISMVTSEGWKIRAKKMVFATGYETMEYIPSRIVKLNSTYAITSEAYSSVPLFGKSDALIWNTDTPYLYMRTTSDHRILIGGRDESFYSPAKRDLLIKTKARQLSKDYEKIFKGKKFKSEFSWTGTFGSTKDGLPFIGPYKNIPNTYFALGFGGNGITFSVTAAMIITDMIRGKKNNDASLYKFDR